MNSSSEFHPATASDRKRCFDPVVDGATRLLVLGSLPGQKSLDSAQYYANPQNRFWQLMSAVTGRELLALAYPARLQALKEAGVGLWDVVAEAHREGSLDSDIRNRADNDLAALVASLPLLETVAFNGGTAAKLGIKALGPLAARYRIVQLPSSSPAYTLAYAEKLRAWEVLRHALHGPKMNGANGL